MDRDTSANGFGRRGLALLAALLASACTYTGTPMGPGNVTFQLPGTLPPASTGLAMPPALAGNAEVIAPAPAPQTGVYAGIARNIDDPGGMCADPVRVKRFFVNGNQVSFGAFHGTIQPGGRLKMQAGDAYVYGQFIGSHFEGRFWQERMGGGSVAYSEPQACGYSLSLEPVG
jgi:hypothetical protein